MPATPTGRFAFRYRWPDIFDDLLRVLPQQTDARVRDAVAQAIARMEDNAKALEDYLNNRNAIETLFSFDGALIVSASKKRYYPRVPQKLVECVATLDTAGTSNTIVTLYKNTTALTQTLTLGSGANYVKVRGLSVNFQPDVDYFTVGVTTLGTGGPADLVVHPRWA